MATPVETAAPTPAPVAVQQVAVHPMALPSHPVWSQLSMWLQVILAIVPAALAPLVGAKTLSVITTETQLAGGVLAGVEQANAQQQASQ